MSTYCASWITANDAATIRVSLTDSGRRIVEHAERQWGLVLLPLGDGEVGCEVQAMYPAGSVRHAVDGLRALVARLRAAVAENPATTNR